MPLALLLMPGLPARFAATGEAPAEEFVSLPIAAARCAQAPGERIEEADCEPITGARFEVATEDGAFLGACITEDVAAPQPGLLVGVCEVPVPPSVTVVVTEDVSTIPAAYAPSRNPITVETPALGPPQGPRSPVTFVNLPGFRVVARAFAWEEGVNGGPALGDVCFRLTGTSVDRRACTDTAPNASTSAVFDDIPVGTYTLEVITAPAGCTTPDSPQAVDVAGFEPHQTRYADAAFTCEPVPFTIHLAECARVTPGDIEEACRANGRAGVGFDVDGMTVTTGADGTVTTTVGVESIVKVSQDPASLDGYVDAYVRCVDLVDGTVLRAAHVPQGSFLVPAIPAGAGAVCDVYNISPTAPPIAGRPAHLHAGGCDDLEPEARFELTDLAPAQGPAEGAEEAIAAAASYTVLDVPLGDLLADDHAITVHVAVDAPADDGEKESVVACGEIGGPRWPDGAVVVGLREQNGSGFTGIVYLDPDPANPERTQVSAFLARDLAEAPDGGRDLFHLPIQVVNCTALPTDAPVFLAEAEECEAGVGIRFEATADNGTALGACVSKAAGTIAGRCTIPVPIGAIVFVNEDVTTLPPGYAPHVNPRPFAVPTPSYRGEVHFVGSVGFVNLPEGGAETTPAAERDMPTDTGSRGAAGRVSRPLPLFGHALRAGRSPELDVPVSLPRQSAGVTIRRCEIGLRAFARFRGGRCGSVTRARLPGMRMRRRES
jgi:hypothetical protein